MAYDVFISYSTHDLSVVDKFVKGLTDAGYSVWIDKTGVSGGDEFRKKIVQGIKQSTIVLFFSSVNSNASKWTVKEIVYAVNKDKVIIPVRLDNSEYADIIDFDICGLSYVKCDLNQPLSCLEELVAHIANHIGTRPPIVTPVEVSQSLNELYSLGYSFYEKGDYVQAVEFFRQAAEQGSADAQCMLGTCYYIGQGVVQDYNESFKWYRKAADQGNVYGQDGLGNCYYLGLGVAQDYNEAVELYRKPAEMGIVNAQCMLGTCYYNGQGVAQDYNEAVKWYRKSADQGFANAQYMIGTCYEYGKGVSRDYSEAVRWYRKSVEQGNAYGQNALGNCYYNGHGVVQDYSEAVKWYRKSADQDFANAQYMMGVCYEYGLGVSLGYNEAIKWYRKAAAQGQADAIKALERLGK